MSPALDQGGQHTRVPRRHRASRKGVRGTCRVVDLGRCGKKGATSRGCEAGTQRMDAAFNERTSPGPGTANALFFGFKPADLEPRAVAEDAKKPAPDPFDFEQLLSKVELDVWHWNDPKISSEQKKTWTARKDRNLPRRNTTSMPTARSLWPDRTCPSSSSRTCAVCARNLRCALCEGRPPGVRGLATSSGRFSDGSRKLVTARLSGRSILSPDARTIAFFPRTAHWHFYDCASGQTRNARAASVLHFITKRTTPRPRLPLTARPLGG